MGAFNSGVTVHPPPEAFHPEIFFKIAEKMRGERNKGKEEREKWGEKGEGERKRRRKGERKEKEEREKRGKEGEGEGRGSVLYNQSC